MSSALLKVTTLIATFGLTMFFNEAVVVIWGKVPFNIDIPAALDGFVEIFPGVNYPVYRLAITGAIRKVFTETPEKFDPRDYLKPAREAMKTEKPQTLAR